MVVADLNRPAILTELNQISHSLVGTFGVYDAVLFDMLFGQFSPQGKLLFEIPSSMEAVIEQKRIYQMTLLHQCSAMVMVYAFK